MKSSSLIHRARAYFAGLIVVGLALGVSSLAAAEPRVTFHNSIAPLPPAVAATRQALAATSVTTETLEFGISLKMRDFDQMQARVARGEIISRAELEHSYLPLQSDYDAVVKWLTDEGFTITQHDASRLVVYAKGTLAQVQSSLEVHLVKVTGNDGLTYSAADTEPSLPLRIATPVLGINHLQPFNHRLKRAIRQPLTSNAPPFKIKEIMAAYNGSNLGVTGANQTIAILIDTGAKSSDLTAFWSANSIAQSTSNVTTVNVIGGTLPAASGEETLDIEWTSGIASAAKIRVYASKDLSDANLDKCLQRLINDLPSQPTIHQLSISLGLGETYGSSAQFTTDQQLFASIVSGGVNIFCSSGDGGSTPDSNGGTTGPLQVEHYASDPNVTAVGGTSLYVNSSTGARTSESAWSGSGGGVSVIFNKPTWQTGTGVPAGTKRFVPDVSFPADPDTGAYVYLAGKVQQYGGTSWSAPTWAGFCALINEARATAGKTPLGLINASLYPLIGTNNFYDITTGSNANSTTAAGKYAATVGYDEVTGIGSPHMANLLATLVGAASPVPTITSFTPTSGVQNTTVVITGTNFTSASAVKFNGTTATFTVNSSTQITTASPTGATTGPIAVTTPGGTATSSTSFTVTAGTPSPSISGFSPSYGAPGTTVVITGVNLSAVTAVKFNGTNATSFVINSATQISAVVPAAATVGPISVTNASATATSTASFTPLTGDGTPTIASFTPTSGAANTSVVITGTNFVNVSSVTFGSVAAVSPSIDSATQITASVPSGAATGPIVVTTGLGSVTSSSNFTVPVSTAGAVVISQVYGGGGNTGATYANDYIELYNRSSAAVNIAGWSVQYSSASGTTWSSIPITGTIQPSRYFLVKAASGGTVGAALPTADATGTGVNLSATSGKVALMNTTTLITTSSPGGLASLIDLVGYGSANAYEGSGPAAAPSATSADIRLGSGATDTNNNTADFTTGTPAPRNSATGVAAPDFTITKSHSGNFTQGDTGRNYTLTVTNSGTASSSGTVTVTDTLPSGLTATAFSGTGWTANLANLTATRSDVLTAGASYPTLTLTVDVAANATTATNVASVSGGGETNTANNSASDPTTIVATGGGTSGGVLAGFDVSAQSSYGTSPLAATATDASVTVGGLTRGSGVTKSGTAAAGGWGGNSFDSSSTAIAVAANKFATFTVTPKSGYHTSFTSISKFDYRISGSGPPNGELQYQIGAGAFIDIAPLAYPSSASTGASIAAIDLSGVAGLQNVAAGNVVTFRIVNYGATSTGGTWYIFNKGTSTAPDLSVSGTSTQDAPDLVIAKTHAGNFTQGETGKTYTLAVSNTGALATTGTVTVVDTLPSGLIATSFIGSGWTTNLNTLTATRSDVLAVGASYPALTLTVSVAGNAATSLTNVASVSGGGETNTTNDSTNDVTTIQALTPSQSWRQQWFGSTASTGAGADDATPADDGIVNLVKYALNLVPPQTPATTAGAVVLDKTTGLLRVTVTKNSAATDVTFRIEGTSTLGNPNSWSTTGIVIDQNTSAILQAHDTTPLNSGPRFLRLVISR